MKKTSLLLNKGKEATIVERKYYQEITDYILFSMIKTRSNITYTMSIVSCFAKNLLHLHNKVVKTIFCYLKVIKDVEITYRVE